MQPDDAPLPTGITLGNALAGVPCGIQPGSGNYHLRLAGCDDCNAWELLRLTLEQVETLHWTGYVRQAMYEAYLHVWATNVPRFSPLGIEWATPPSDPEVIALVDLLRRLDAKARGNR